MKAGKALKVAGALAASLILLTVLAGCGQASKPSPKSETSSSTPAKSTSQTSPSTQTSPSPAPSSSGSTPSSSSASSAPTGSSASTSAASSTPAASSSPSASSPADSTSASTQAMPSNEVLYLLAYIKYRGGIQNITPSDLIVDEYMIGTQKGTVWPNTPPKQVPLQMVVSGKEVKVIGPAPPPTPESDAMYSLKALYSIDSLVNEYYSTPSQQAEVNSILQEGERHNLLDVLAFMHSTLWINGGTNFQRYQFGLFGDLLTDGGTDVYSLVAIKGSEVVLCINSKARASYPWHHQYYYFNAQSLLDKYYSTPAQKSQVNEYISFGTKNGSWE